MMSSSVTPERPVAAGPAPILVVEDDPRMRQFIQWALEDEGLPVEVAADGRQAVELGTRTRPALVVLDIGLPVLDGYGVAAALRRAYGADLAILTVTADGRAAEKARRVGAFAHLAKPFDVDDLLAAVFRGLARAH
jgi:CheY-like chemotaxis protein